jgi:hypothetical protein
VTLKFNAMCHRKDQHTGGMHLVHFQGRTVYRLRVSDNRLLRRIFGPKKEIYHNNEMKEDDSTWNI